MSIPVEWVDRIFTKLSLAYGREFIGRWEGLSIGDVKTDWAHELAGFENWPEAIAFAFDHLPEKPPTVQQFRGICMKAPARQNLALPAPQANHDRMKAEIAKLKESMSAKPVSRGTNRDWAHRIINRHNAGEKISSATLNMARFSITN
jgi:hypothetical protein